MSAQPLFTLRGHATGVTAVVQLELEDEVCLVSGDQEGTVVLWNLITFKKIKSYPKICNSQVQSIRVVPLEVGGERNTVLIVQSRNDGLFLFSLAEDNDFVKLINYPTYEALFSRGDAIPTFASKAVLAYPSCINNHLVTIRLIGPDAKTILSGSAQRYQEEDSKKGSLFDIKIEQEDSAFLLFAAYEDSTICAFSFNLKDTIHVPVLESSGIKIDLIRRFDLKFGDFIGSLSVDLVDESYRLIAGAPTKDVYVIKTPKDMRSSEKDEVDQIKLKRRGVSRIATDAHSDVAAIACWDSSIVIYSMRSRSLIETLHHHTKQTQDLIFLDKPLLHDNADDDEHDSYGTDSQKSRESGRLLLCAASMDGTISLTYIG